MGFKYHIGLNFLKFTGHRAVQAGPQGVFPPLGREQEEQRRGTELFRLRRISGHLHVGVDVSKVIVWMKKFAISRRKEDGLSGANVMNASTLDGGSPNSSAALSRPSPGLRLAASHRTHSVMMSDILEEKAEESRALSKERDADAAAQKGAAKKPDTKNSGGGKDSK